MHSLGSLPVRPPRTLDSHGIAFGLVHARTTVLHPRSRCAPRASSQGGDAYMPAGNVSGGVRCVVERVHVPELHM